MASSVVNHTVVPKEAWIEARKKLLAKEKEFTRLRDQLSQERRALPWERVEKPYIFDGPTGKATFSQLFAGSSQLVVYHLMFAPNDEAACKSCSWWADNFERNAIHLKHRDVTIVAVSRAPLDKLEAFKKRMGWTFPWFSSGNTDFNYDYQASARPEELVAGKVYYNYTLCEWPGGSEMPGISVFYKDTAGNIFHTYSCYQRGLDMLNAGYHYLDLVPKGRDETDLPYGMAWLRHRDAYEEAHAPK